MRRIAVMNQKGGVGKTTTTANLGAALALQGRRVVLVDMDAQANLSLSLNVEVAADAPSSYTVLLGSTTFEEALRPTSIPNLRLVASHLDLSGAELELAGAIGREYVLRDALRQWADVAGGEPADYVLFDCPPSLGLLSINALAASREVLITLQTEFLALQGMSKLVSVVQLLRRRLNPELVITGILPCLYDSRLKLAREVLGEIRAYFPGQVLSKPVRSSVKLAEAPSYGRTIFEYAPESHGAQDYMQVAREIIRQETRDPALAGLPPFDERITSAARSASATTAAPSPRIATSAARDEIPSNAPAVESPSPPKRGRFTAREETPASVAAIRTEPASAAIDRAHAKPNADSAVPKPRVTIAPSPIEPAVGASTPSKRKRQPLAKSSAPSGSVTPATPTKAKVALAPVVDAPPLREPVEIPAAPSEPAVQAPSISKRERLPVREVLPAPKPAPVAKPATSTKRAPKTRASQPNSSITPARAPQRVSSEPPVRAPQQVSSEPSARPAPAQDSLAPVARTNDHTSLAPRRVLRADDFPPLPPDAFEILTSFGNER